MHETKTSINNLSQRKHLCTTFQSQKLNIASNPEAFPPASSQSRSLPSPQRCSLSLCLTLEFSFPCFSGFYRWNHVSALLRNCVWLTSFNILMVRFTHATACNSSSFIFVVQLFALYDWLFHNFIYPYYYWCMFMLFPILTITNIVVVSILIFFFSIIVYYRILNMVPCAIQ